MPRVKGSPAKCVKSTNPANPSNSWLFLVKGDALQRGACSPDIVRLRHPATGEPAMFLFSPNDDTVQEIMTLAEEKRSWFIGDSVKQDGKLYLSTPFDPVFLILPYLVKANATVPLVQLLQDDEFPETMRLLKCPGVKNLTQVADRKGDDDLNAYKYNEDKVLSWLQKKTERVAEVLRTKNVHVTGGSISATFVKSTVEAPAPKEAFLRYAHGIVSEYLTVELSHKLQHYLNIPADDLSLGKRKNIPAPSVEPKRVKLSEEENTKTSEIAKGDGVDFSKFEKQPDKLSSKEKARQKAAQGSKSITSFFKKK